MTLTIGELHSPSRRNLLYDVRCRTFDPLNLPFHFSFDTIVKNLGAKRIVVIFQRFEKLKFSSSFDAFSLLLNLKVHVWNKFQVTTLRVRATDPYMCPGARVPLKFLETSHSRSRKPYDFTWYFEFSGYTF